MTADVWTNKARSFLGVSIHFLDENLDRKSYLLAFRRVYGRHTYIVLAEMILSIQKEFNIKRSKVTHIVTDGASNFRKAFSIFGAPDGICEGSTDESANVHSTSIQNEDEEEELEIEEVLAPEVVEDSLYFPPETISESLNFHVINDDDEDDCDEYLHLPKQERCMAHSLNLLGTTDFEKNLKISSPRCFDILTSGYGKLKNFWALNSRSTVAHEIVFNVCKRSFPCPNATRWNSKFDAITVAEKHKLLIKNAIDEINKEVNKNIGGKRSKKLEQLSSMEWKVLKDYSNTLKPIAIALDILQGDCRACQGYVLPTLYAIKASFETNIKEKNFTSDYGLSMNECSLKCLTTRFEAIMKFNEENKELILASVIHPSFKISWIENERDKEYAQTLLINTYIDMANDKQKRPPNDSSQYEKTQNNSAESQFFKRLRQGERRTCTDDTLTLDVWKYLLQSIEDPNLDQVRGVPILEDIFRRYNTTLSSSGVIERIFSKALLVFTPRRNRITDTNFEKALYIQQNRDLLL
ncbi:uncharacterized protein LOC116347299 [Contarinia nasturtii]|uniref:uncharacterized protein LOC116347299 n=1 Tax=Contarinia nasturtii TaxID=265458 RepID=UPI0012D385E9|nr:uncharacterized protein LOC116347299 [Contarinia nasturtii]XP_031633720.1 uncharacterized protein LOC116347299 [Contarinia nasturtii]